MTRRLDKGDIEAMTRVFRARDKLMLRVKGDRQRGLSDRFAWMLRSGYEAYGSFVADELRAFCVLGPWNDMPFFTFSLLQHLPTAGGLNLHTHGLSFCVDLGLASLEARGYTHMVFQRIDDPKWRREELRKTSGRVGRYAFLTVESIPAGGRSKWKVFNTRVLGGRPASHDSVIVLGARPEVA